MGESDPYRELYLPLMLSMTLGQPGAYWDARYSEELSRVNAARVHMGECLKAQSAQQKSQGNATGVRSEAGNAVQVVQTALDELYAWYGLPATVLSIASISALPLGIRLCRAIP